MKANSTDTGIRTAFGFKRRLHNHTKSNYFNTLHSKLKKLLYFP